MKLRDFALGRGDDLYTSKAQMLELRRHVGLIARDAVQRFGEHNVELAALGVLQQRLHTGPENDAGAGNGGIVMGPPSSTTAKAWIWQ